MVIVKEKSIQENRFKYDTVKNVQVFGTKARITIEFDITKTIKGLAWDINPYGITKEQLDPKYLADIIACQLDWDAFLLVTNDDHELAHAFAEIND
jgi:hypothetical protein